MKLKSSFNDFMLTFRENFKPLLSELVIVSYELMNFKG